MLSGKVTARPGNGASWFNPVWLGYAAAIAALCFAGAVLGWGWYSSCLVMNLPHSGLLCSPGDFGVGFENVSIPSGGRELKGWFVPARRASDRTVIVAHGWGANRSHMLEGSLFLLGGVPCNLLYFDFTNHGESGGACSSLSRYESEDVRSAVRFLKEKKPRFARRVGVLGFSMGASAALAAAADDPEIEAVAAESAFASFNDVISRFARLFYHLPEFPFSDSTLFFVTRRLGFDPEAYAPGRCVGRIAPRPVLLIYGDSDRRMPSSEGKILYGRAGQPKKLWIVDHADHGGAYFEATSEYEAEVGAFFKRAFNTKKQKGVQP